MVHTYLSICLVTALEVKFHLKIGIVWDILLKQFKKPNQMKYSVLKRPLLEYCVQFCTPHDKKDTDILQSPGEVTKVVRAWNTRCVSKRRMYHCHLNICPDLQTECKKQMATSQKSLSALLSVKSVKKVPEKEVLGQLSLITADEKPHSVFSLSPVISTC